MTTSVRYLLTKSLDICPLSSVILCCNIVYQQVGDFGMSRELVDAEYYVSQGGTIPVRWTAPEAVYYRKYSTASDVWSYGCLLYEIWSLGHKPFEGCSNTKVLIGITVCVPQQILSIVQILLSPCLLQVLEKLGTGYRLPPPPGCPRMIYEIMIQCWYGCHLFINVQCMKCMC